MAVDPDQPPVDLTVVTTICNKEEDGIMGSIDWEALREGEFAASIFGAVWNGC